MTLPKLVSVLGRVAAYPSPGSSPRSEPPSPTRGEGSNDNVEIRVSHSKTSRNRRTLTAAQAVVAAGLLNQDRAFALLCNVTTPKMEERCDQAHRADRRHHA